MFEEHPSVFAPLDNTPLWKYMSFSKFVNLLNGFMYFNRIDSFEDVFECHWPKLNMKYFELEHKRTGNPPTPFDDIARKLIYVTCFHKSSYETAFMWKQYSQEDGLAIQTSLQRLKDSFHLTSNPIYISDVHYIDYNTEPILNMGNLLSLAIHKRKSFEFEQELRCIQMLEFMDSNGNLLEEYRRSDDSERMDFEKTPMGIKVPIDLSLLIEKIYVSPYAPNYIEENLKLLMRKFELDIEIVKSNLYTII